MGDAAEVLGIFIPKVLSNSALRMIASNHLINP